MRNPADGAPALAELDADDLDGLPTRGILEQARSLQGCPVESIPEALKERLSSGEVGLVDEISRQSAAPAAPADCVRALKKMRFDRERASVQREIDRLQEQGAAHFDEQIVALWDRKKDLLQRIEALMGSHP
jgi:hypothetical protein